jgi:uncharacterized protein (DUF433 family)
VTHFPWKDSEVDYERLRSGEYDVEEEEGLPLIPLGEVYEVTVWENRGSIEETYIADCGVERACQRALEVAKERGIPAWDTIRRLRPEHVLIAGAAFETIPGDESVAVKELELNESEKEFLESAFVAVHRETGVASWGETREAALEELERDVEYFEAAKARGDRSGEIVETPSVLGGDPRVDGSRIGVLHIVECRESRGEDVSPAVIAAQFSGVLSVGEVEAALEWAETHSERLAEVRRAQDEVREDSSW